MSDPVNKELIVHLQGAHAGREAFEAAAQRAEGRFYEAEMRQMANELKQEHAEITELVERTGGNPQAPQHKVTEIALRAAGFASRLVHQEGTMTDPLEIEKLRIAVAGKIIGWEVILTAEPYDDRIDRAQIQRLHDLAVSQQERLKAIHLRLVDEVFNPDGDAENDSGNGDEK